MRRGLIAVLPLIVLVGWQETRADDPAGQIADRVRGLVTRAAGPVVMDGKLDEWTGAFCTPVAYNHKDPANRASQLFYLWDDQALYIGLRALDQKQANPSPLNGLFNGDAIEFYVDARPGDALTGKEWTAGSYHLYYTAFDMTQIGPRWVMRRGISTSETVLTGVEVAATATDSAYMLEFKLPWSNFPGFKPVEGSVLALDAELCFSDGASRVDRTFAYGSPLSVQQPASQGRVQLVGRGPQPALPAAVQADRFPLWVETPWVQPERARVQAVLAVPPEMVGKVQAATIRVHGLDGAILETEPMRADSFGPEGLNFVRYLASWPVDRHAPGTYFVTAEVTFPDRSPPVKVAPRMVHEANMTGR